MPIRNMPAFNMRRESLTRLVGGKCVLQLYGESYIITYNKTEKGITTYLRGDGIPPITNNFVPNELSFISYPTMNDFIDYLNESNLLWRRQVGFIDKDFFKEFSVVIKGDNYKDIYCEKMWAQWNKKSTYL